MKRIQTLEAEKAQKQIVIDDYKKQLKDCQKQTAQEIIDFIKEAFIWGKVPYFDLSAVGIDKAR